MNPKFEIRIATNRRQYYFVLLSKNGKIVATSEMYDTKQACRKGIRAVKWNSLIAATEDKSL